MAKRIITISREFGQLKLLCGFYVVADPTTTLQVKNTGSLSVNRYGWINIWMAILGQFFTQFPLFFESCLILLKTWLEIFPDNAGILRIYLLQFSAIVGYKTRRAA